MRTPFSLRPALIVALLALSTWWSALAQELQLPNRPGTVKFAAIGDMGTGERPQYEVAAEMVRRRGEFPFDFVIMLGDNMYGRQRPADFVTKFERPYKPLLDNGVRFFASLGNHDLQSNRFYKLWNMNGERYYTFARGNVRFFALDTDYLDSAQLAWLEAELAAATEGWKICFFHHPLYSSAREHGSEIDLRTVLEPVLVKHRVNAVFSGHDHVYERL
ncbi:MAG: metallophosphoesterase, partial [Vicinamibacterales bacterium]